MGERLSFQNDFKDDFLPSSEAEGQEEGGEKQKERKRLGERILGALRRDSEKVEQRRVKKLARKKGYHKNEEGEWVRLERKSDGSTTETPVPWFELDEKYPEVAEKYEEAIEKYYGPYKKGGKYQRRYYHYLDDDERGYFKQGILENIEKFRTLESESWDDVAYLSFVEDRGDMEFFRLIDEARDGSEESFSEYIDNIQKKRRVIEKILGRMGTEEKSDFLKHYDGRQILGMIGSFYGDECEREDFIEFTVSLGSAGQDEMKIANDGIEGVLKHGGSEYLDEYSKTIKDIDAALGEQSWQVTPVLRSYVRRNGLDEKTIRGFYRIFDDVLEGKKDLDDFGQDLAEFREGEFGLEMYTIECYRQVNEPENIDYLVRIHNEIPTTDFGKREQNRKDGSALEDRFFGSRTFIHEERPGVHEIVSAIVDFYDGKDGDIDDVEEKKNKVREAIFKYPNYGLHKRLVKTFFNPESYERKVGDGEEKEKVIDILRRLKENTEPTPLSIPETRYPELNEALERIEPILNEKTGEVRVGISEVGEAVVILNRILLDGEGEQSLFPSTISAIAYLDKMSAYALRGVSDKEWSELAFDDGFKEIVRFSELTSSMGYREEDFEQFFGNLRRKTSEGFGEEEVDHEKIREAYKTLGSRITGNMEKLGAKYRSDPRTERFSRAIWSGNLAHELIGLFEKF